MYSSTYLGVEASMALVERAKAEEDKPLAVVVTAAELVPTPISVFIAAATAMQLSVVAELSAAA